MHDDDPYAQLRTAVARWAPLSSSQFAALARIFTVRTAAAHAHVVLPGDRVHELLFVGRGLLRFYYVADDGTESNKAFVTEDEFAVPLAAFRLQLPVPYGVQALEPTTYLAADYAAFTALFDADPAFERLGRQLAEYLLMRKELRTRSFLQQDAAARLADFTAQHPDLVARVPQYHIASYLGISEVSLSRLKRSAAAS